MGLSTTRGIQLTLPKNSWESSMRRGSYFAIITAVMMMVSPYAAIAGSHHDRYSIVSIRVHPGAESRNVLILDQRTGTLCSWSDATGPTLLPAMLQLGNTGSFARVIHIGR